jgi:hypothetical protein
MASSLRGHPGNESVEVRYAALATGDAAAPR